MSYIGRLFHFRQAVCHRHGRLLQVLQAALGGVQACANCLPVSHLHSITISEYGLYGAAACDHTCTEIMTHMLTAC